MISVSERPDWRETMRADIDSLPQSRRPREADLVKTQTDFRLSTISAVRQAAASRGVTVAAFIRRATYAMAAHELGIGITELTSRDDRMANASGFSISDPLGDRFGEWEIELLRGEEPS